MIVEHAAAKVNLALHVTGRRSDGYHGLDSLVVFADAADVLRLAQGTADSFRLAGPFGDALASEPDNLVLRARDLLAGPAAARGDGRTGLELSLEKNLPVASGIGGGSADAAAALRGINRLLGIGHDIRRLQELALSLGADVPMCVAGRAARVSGIGERIEPLAGFRPLPGLLVNPGVAVATPAVFRALERRTNPPLPPLPDCWGTPAEVAAFLEGCRNDLELPARSLVPEIGEALSLLREQSGCKLARMSGSGATCFALFETDEEVTAAAAALAALRPKWWVRACRLGDDPFAANAPTDGRATAAQ